MVNVVTILCNKETCILHTNCVFVLRMILTTDTDYFPDRTKSLYFIKHTDSSLREKK